MKKHCLLGHDFRRHSVSAPMRNKIDSDWNDKKNSVVAARSFESLQPIKSIRILTRKSIALGNRFCFHTKHTRQENFFTQQGVFQEKKCHWARIGWGSLTAQTLAAFRANKYFSTWLVTVVPEIFLLRTVWRMAIIVSKKGYEYTNKMKMRTTFYSSRDRVLEAVRVIEIINNTIEYKITKYLMVILQNILLLKYICV